MTPKKEKNSKTSRIEDDLKTPPGEFLVPTDHGILDKNSWIKKIKKKIEKKID